MRRTMTSVTATHLPSTINGGGKLRKFTSGMECQGFWQPDRHETYAWPTTTLTPVATLSIALTGITEVFVPGFTPLRSRVCSQVA